MKDLIPYGLILVAFVGAAVIFRDQVMELFNQITAQIGL